MSSDRVALVIPAWNEPESIAAVLDEVPAASVNDILVVVGSPGDPTGPVAARCGARIVVQQRRGYGAACAEGAAAAIAGGANILAFLDGDYADPPASLPRVLEPILARRADLVLGCRDLQSSPGVLPLHARVGNQAVLWMLRLILRAPVPRDLPSFKAIRRGSLDQLRMREMTYGWTVEMLVKAIRAQLRIEQVTIPYRPRLAGASKVSGTVRGTMGAAWKLCSCAVQYAFWRPAATPSVPVFPRR